MTSKLRPEWGDGDVATGGAKPVLRQAQPVVSSPIRNPPPKGAEEREKGMSSRFSWFRRPSRGGFRVGALTTGCASPGYRLRSTRGYSPRPRWGRHEHRTRFSSVPSITIHWRRGHRRYPRPRGKCPAEPLPFPHPVAHNPRVAGNCRQDDDVPVRRPNAGGQG